MSALKGFPPKLFIIGAQKAGTTQLSELLSQHSDICVAASKEPDFFTRHFDKGFDWYKKEFADLDKVLLDASTSYTSRPLPTLFPDDVADETDPLVGVPARIHQASPEAKLIYIVRNPVKRTYSGYWHQVTAGYEDRSLSTALEQDSSYYRISKYADQLAHYLDCFEKKNILVVEFEDLIKKPQQVLSDCFRFIELPQIEQIDEEIHKNKSFQLTGTLAYINQNIIKIKPILKLVRKLAPDPIVEFGKKHLTKSVPKITEQETTQLSLHFDNEVAKVKKLVNHHENSSA